MATTNLYILTADTVNTTTSYQTIPNLQFTLSAGISYDIHAHGTFSVSGTTSGGTGGINIKINTPTGVNPNVQTLANNSSNLNIKTNVLTFNGDNTGIVGTQNGTTLMWLINGIVKGGTSGGTFSLSFKNATGGQQATILANSAMVVVN